MGGIIKNSPLREKRDLFDCLRRGQLREGSTVATLFGGLPAKALGKGGENWRRGFVKRVLELQGGGSEKTPLLTCESLEEEKLIIKPSSGLFAKKR